MQVLYSVCVIYMNCFVASYCCL